MIVIIVLFHLDYLAKQEEVYQHLDKQYGIDYRHDLKQL